MIRRPQRSPLFPYTALFRSRVALGRAIVRNADVFLMDEPLSNLDAKLRVQTRAELIKLHDRVNTTTIYVTHDQVDRKSTRLNSSHANISYAVFCLKKKKYNK